MSAIEETVTVLVTGFGAFQDVTKNPSWEIASRLSQYYSSSSLNDYNHVETTIRVIVHPEPVRAAYHSIHDLIPTLLQSHQPDIVLHIGLATERDYFAIEQSADRDDYHQNLDVDRKVFTKAETKKSWGTTKSGAERLSTTLDLDDVMERWRKGLGLSTTENSGGGEKEERGGEGKKKKKKQKRGAADMAVDVDVRLSDGVGNYVCGFIYYATLAGLARQRDDSQRRAVFLHVPPLETEVDVEKGVKVVLALIEALVGTWRTQKPL